MELKQLYEAGILTKEEMESEKAKILKSTPDEPRKAEEVEVKDEEAEQIVSQTPTEETTYYDDEEELSFFQKYKTYILIGLALFVAFLIYFITGISSSSNDNPLQSNSEVVVDNDSITIAPEVQKELNEEAAKLREYFLKTEKEDIPLSFAIENADIKKAIIRQYSQQYYDAIKGALNIPGSSSDAISKSGDSYIASSTCGNGGIMSIDFSYNTKDRELIIITKIAGVLMDRYGSVDENKLNKNLEERAITFRQVKNEFLNETKTSDLLGNVAVYKLEFHHCKYSDIEEYKYMLTATDYYDYKLYTDNEQYANLNFPCSIILFARLVERDTKQYGGYEFIFEDAGLLLVDKK